MKYLYNLQVIDFIIFISIFYRSSHRRCSVKNMFLETSQISQACNFIEKNTLAQMFSCEFCEISKNTFTEHLQKTASIFNTI